MVPPALTSGCRAGAAAIERGWLGSPAVGIWVRPQPSTPTEYGTIPSCPASPASTSRVPLSRQATSTTRDSSGTIARKSRSATLPSSARTTVPM